MNLQDVIDDIEKSVEENEIKSDIGSVQTAGRREDFGCSNGNVIILLPETIHTGTDISIMAMLCPNEWNCDNRKIVQVIHDITLENHREMKDMRFSDTLDMLEGYPMFNVLHGQHITVTRPQLFIWSFNVVDGYNDPYNQERYQNYFEIDRSKRVIFSDKWSMLTLKEARVWSRNMCYVYRKEIMEMRVHERKTLYTDNQTFPPLEIERLDKGNFRLCQCGLWWREDGRA